MNKFCPDFSIITVCYNSDKTIAQTIESVLNQSYKNYEYLIIDGKSSDGTLDIIKKYEPLFNGRLKWVSEPDSGIYNAMNKGISLTKGKLIGIINSDDWYEEDALLSVFNEFSKEQNTAKVFYGLLRNLLNERPYNIVAHMHEFIAKGMLPHPTCFVNKEIYEKQGLFNEKYKLAADYDLLLRYYLNGVPFCFIDKIIANFRMGGETDIQKELSLKETNEIRHHYNLLSKKDLICRAIYLNFKKTIKKILKTRL